MRRGGVRRRCGRGVPPGSGTSLIRAEPFRVRASRPDCSSARTRSLTRSPCSLRTGVRCTSQPVPRRAHRGIQSGLLRRPGSLGGVCAPVAEQRPTCRNRPDRTRLGRGPAQRRGRPAPSLRTACRSSVLRRCLNRLAGGGGEESSLGTPGRDRRRRRCCLDTASRWRARPFPRSRAPPRDAGPSKQFLTAARQAGVDVTDEQALTTFVAGWNARSSAS